MKKEIVDGVALSKRKDVYQSGCYLRLLWIMHRHCPAFHLRFQNQLPQKNLPFSALSRNDNPEKNAPQKVRGAREKYYSTEQTSLVYSMQLNSSVSLPSFGCSIIGDWEGFTITNSSEPVCRDTLLNQVHSYCISTCL